MSRARSAATAAAAAAAKTFTWLNFQLFFIATYSQRPPLIAGSRILNVQFIKKLFIVQRNWFRKSRDEKFWHCVWQTDGRMHRFHIIRQAKDLRQPAMRSANVLPHFRPCHMTSNTFSLIYSRHTICCICRTCVQRASISCHTHFCTAFHLQLIWFDWLGQHQEGREEAGKVAAPTLRFSSSLPVFKVRRASCLRRHWVIDFFDLAWPGWRLQLAGALKIACPKTRSVCSHTHYTHKYTYILKNETVWLPKLWTAVWQEFDTKLLEFNANIQWNSLQILGFFLQYC